MIRGLPPNAGVPVPCGHFHRIAFRWRLGTAVIRGEHTFVRGAEQDDVEALYRLYMDRVPRAGLLDARREPMLPTRADLRDLLTRKEISEGSFYTVEDRQGVIVGFCSLRGLNTEARFAEYGLQLADVSLYDSEIATEAHAFLLDRAFMRLGLNKVLAHGLSSELALGAFFRRVGFTSAGVQRDVLYTGGTWCHLETFVLQHPDHPRSDSAA